MFLNIEIHNQYQYINHNQAYLRLIIKSETYDKKPNTHYANFLLFMLFKC